MLKVWSSCEQGTQGPERGGGDQARAHDGNQCGGARRFERTSMTLVVRTKNVWCRRDERSCSWQLVTVLADGCDALTCWFWSRARRDESAFAAIRAGAGGGGEGEEGREAQQEGLLPELEQHDHASRREDANDHRVESQVQADFPAVQGAEGGGREHAASYQEIRHDEGERETRLRTRESRVQSSRRRESENVLRRRELRKENANWVWELRTTMHTGGEWRWGGRQHDRGFCWSS
eukprot:370222-Hanusia_phi.AAC.3